MTGSCIARGCGGGVMEATTGIGGGVGDPAAIGEIGNGSAIVRACGRSAFALPLLFLLWGLERRLLLQTQGLRGAFAVLEARVGQRKRRAVAVPLDGLAHETGTSGSTMQRGVGATPAFAGRNVLLVDANERQQKKVEEELGEADSAIYFIPANATKLSRSVRASQ